MCDTIGYGCFCGMECAEHIVDNAFGRVGLDQRNMFVGCSVVNRVWPIGLKDFFKAALAGHGTEQRYELDRQTLDRTEGKQLLMNTVQGKLAVIEHQQLAWHLVQYLTAQFTSNAAAAARHQHHFPCKVVRQQGGPRRYRVTAKQIFNIQLFEVLDSDPATGKIRQAGKGSKMHRQRPQSFNDVVTSLASCTRKRQKNIRHPMNGDQTNNLFR